MSQASLDFEVDAFVLPRRRPGVQWSISRSRCYWSANMEVNGRTTTRTTLSHRPERGDGRLARLEREHFHES